MKRFIKIAETLVVLMVMAVYSHAQTPTYSCVATADTLMTSKIYQFDIYIYRTGTTNLYLNNYQLSFKINNSAGILNGGAISGAYVAGSSALPPAFVPGGINVFNIGGTLYLRINGCPSTSNGTLIPTTGLKIGSFRFTNTVNYGQINPNTIWWDGSPAFTYIYAIVPPAPTGPVVEISNISYHTTSFTDPVFNAPVLAYNMTGGGSYCPGGSGMPVGLSGSQTGVQYRLLKNGTPVGSWIAGTGSAISLGNQTAGTYTASAYRKATYLTNNMTGSVTVTQIIVTPAIAGNTTPCVNSTGNVYTTEDGMTNYQWSVSAGGTVTGGGTSGSNTVTVTWNTAGAQTVSVNYTDGSGCSALTPTVKNITVNALPTPTISGPNPVCLNSTGNVYTTQAGMTNYTWSITGGTITSGGTSSTNTATVTWTTLGAQSISVGYTNANGCTSASPGVYNVNVNPLPTPTISGQATICTGTGLNTYTTQAGMTNYTWTISSGGTIASGQGTYAVEVYWNTAGAQWIAVNYINASGCSAASPTQLPVTVNAVPGPAGTIQGTATVCAGAQGVAYSVGTITNATYYVWTLPAGVTIASGAGTKSITVNFASNAVSGNITVYGNNTCGNGTSSPPFPVTVNKIPIQPGNISGPTHLCQGAQGIVYSVAAVPGATGYVWTTSPGATIVNGLNTNIITVNFSNTATSGNFRVYGTSPCGNGPVSPPLYVIVNSRPPNPLIGPSTDGFANLGDTLFSSIPEGNQWYLNGEAIQGANDSLLVANWIGDYFTIIDNGTCASETSNHILVGTTGVENQETMNFTVYPVPNDGMFTSRIITSKTEKFDILVYNKLGQKIYDAKDIEVNGILRKVIDLRPVPNGIYTVVFLNEDHMVTRKVVVNF
ncbi:MAG: T9SS type A sorting domain-containing protein [bacterium]